jgi:DDE superfamily endonuclease
LTGAGLSRTWGHHRAHYFFGRARWNPDDLGLALARLAVSLLISAGDPVTIAIDDTLFRRCGKKVWAASWFHDGSAKGPRKTGYGNNWVIAGIVVTLPFCSRPVCLPVMFRLVVKGTSSASRLWLARRICSACSSANTYVRRRAGSPDAAVGGDHLVPRSFSHTAPAVSLASTRRSYVPRPPDTATAALASCTGS